MKFTYSAITAILAAVAQAQSVADLTAQIPSCSLSCLQTAITGAGCSITDNACQCGSAKASISTSATPCVIKACSTSDALKTQQLGNQICMAVGSSSGSASSGGASSTAASAASSASSAPASASSAGSSATGSAASSVSSGASSRTSGAVASASSLASSATSRANSAASSATSSAAAQVTSSGANKAQALGAVGGAALLAAFAL